MNVCPVTCIYYYLTHVAILLYAEAAMVLYLEFNQLLYLEFNPLHAKYAYMRMGVVKKKD